MTDADKEKIYNIIVKSIVDEIDMKMFHCLISDNEEKLLYHIIDGCINKKELFYE
jgi:hypothetical protein